MSITTTHSIAKIIAPKLRNGLAILALSASIFMGSNPINAHAQTNDAKADQFLIENGKKSGVETTETGLQFQTIKPGDGPSPTVRDVALVAYKGTLRDGTIFDENPNAALPVGRLVSGFTEALQKMQVGGTYKIWIPSDIGYGPDDQIDPQTGAIAIAGGSTLVFDVTLIGFKTPAEIEELRRQANAPAPTKSLAEIERLLGFETITPGAGPSPAANDSVLVSYRGTFTDGTIFDQNPYATFTVDQVIPGFSAALQKMQIGGQYKIEIPAEIGYGPNDRINPRTGEVSIPGGSTLIFEISLFHFRSEAEIEKFNKPADNKSNAAPSQ